MSLHKFKTWVTKKKKTILEKSGEKWRTDHKRELSELLNNKNMSKHLEYNCSRYETKSNLEFENREAQVDAGYIETKLDKYKPLSKKNKILALVAVYTGPTIKIKSGVQKGHYPRKEVITWMMGKGPAGVKRAKWTANMDWEGKHPLNRILGFLILDKQPCLCNQPKTVNLKSKKKT